MALIILNNITEWFIIKIFMQFQQNLDPVLFTQILFGHAIKTPSDSFINTFSGVLIFSSIPKVCCPSFWSSFAHKYNWVFMFCIRYMYVLYMYMYTGICICIYIYCIYIFFFSKFTTLRKCPHLHIKTAFLIINVCRMCTFVYVHIWICILLCSTIPNCPGLHIQHFFLNSSNSLH